MIIIKFKLKTYWKRWEASNRRRIQRRSPRRSPRRSRQELALKLFEYVPENREVDLKKRVHSSKICWLKNMNKLRQYMMLLMQKIRQLLTRHSEQSLQMRLRTIKHWLQCGSMAKKVTGTSSGSPSWSKLKPLLRRRLEKMTESA